MVLCKGLLDRVKLAISCQTLDRQHFALMCLDGEHGTRLDACSIQQNGAGATVTSVATKMRSSEIQVLAEQLNQKQARFYAEVIRFAIYFKLKRHPLSFCRHTRGSPRRVLRGCGAAQAQSLASKVLPLRLVCTEPNLAY